MIVIYNNDKACGNGLLNLLNSFAENEKSISFILYSTFIRFQFAKTLIRLYYFIDNKNNKLVILNYIEKLDWRKNSDKYNKSKKNKIDKLIQESIEIALELKKQYYLNSSNYELLSI